MQSFPSCTLFSLHLVSEVSSTAIPTVLEHVPLCAFCGTIVHHKGECSSLIVSGIVVLIVSGGMDDGKSCAVLHQSPINTLVLVHTQCSPVSGV